MAEVGQRRAGALEAVLKCLRAHLDGELLVLGQQIALRLRDALALVVGGREGQMAPLDRAVQIDRTDLRIGHTHETEQLRLGYRGA
ncbi:hypothetical protein ACFQX7_01840 [Luedemannella flava]